MADFALFWCRGVRFPPGGGVSHLGGRGSLPPGPRVVDARTVYKRLGVACWGCVSVLRAGGGVFASALCPFVCAGVVSLAHGGVGGAPGRVAPPPPVAAKTSKAIRPQSCPPVTEHHLSHARSLTVPSHGGSGPTGMCVGVCHEHTHTRIPCASPPHTLQKASQNAVRMPSLCEKTLERHHSRFSPKGKRESAASTTNHPNPHWSNVCVPVRVCTYIYIYKYAPRKHTHPPHSTACSFTNTT